jgi:hypothetical protein
MMANGTAYRRTPQAGWPFVVAEEQKGNRRKLQTVEPTNKTPRLVQWHLDAASVHTCTTLAWSGSGGIGYGRRNQAETAISRYKHLTGPKLRVRSLPAQRGEAAIAVALLNTMIRTAKPVSLRVA